MRNRFNSLPRTAQVPPKHRLGRSVFNHVGWQNSRSNVAHLFLNPRGFFEVASRGMTAGKVHHDDTNITMLVAAKPFCRRYRFGIRRKRGPHIARGCQNDRTNVLHVGLNRPACFQLF